MNYIIINIYKTIILFINMVECQKIIAALESVFQCHVCFHDYEGRIQKAIGTIPLYHRNPYCHIIRNDSRCFQYCCGMEAQDSRQEMTVCRTSFYKRCHAGFFEIAVPVFCDTILTGIMFVGPFSFQEGVDDNILVQAQRMKSIDLVRERQTPPVIAGDTITQLRIFAELTAEQITSVICGGASLIEEEPQKIRITRWLDRNFRKKMRLADLACHLGVGEIRVCQLMREHFNCTFSEALVNRRINHACYLLRSSGMKNAAIATDCGFQDQEYFYRVFKRITGQSPGVYRKQTRSDHVSASTLLA